MFETITTLKYIKFLYESLLIRNSCCTSLKIQHYLEIPKEVMPK
jgi:hypothetical protein